MNPQVLIQGLGSIGFFSSRIFLPAFLTALFLRFRNHIPLVDHMGLLAQIHGQPTWFTSNACIAFLGIMSGAELFARRSHALSVFVHEFDIYLKPVLAALTSLGFISSTDASFAEHAVHQAGYGDMIVPLAVALGSWQAARLRKKIMAVVFDSLNGTHFDRLILWLEELWVFFGVYLLIVFPIIMLIAIGMMIGGMALLRRHLNVVEEKTRRPCASCSTMIYACAVACSKCRAAVDQPHDVGFLGQTKPYPTEHPQSHRYRLIEKRRCAVCATRLKVRDPFQSCGVCGATLLADPAFARQYVDYIAGRLPFVLAISLLLSLIPFIGLIVGVAYYRIALVLPFSQYLPLGRQFLLAWGLRILMIIMMFFQWVPILGGIVVPLMAYLSYLAYRGAFEKVVLAPPTTHAATASPAPAI